MIYSITSRHHLFYQLSRKKSARMVFLDPAHRIDVVYTVELFVWVFAEVAILSTVQSVICVDSAYLAAYQCADLK